VAGTAILDIDGTLVDTNYQHAVAWYRAFRQNGIVLPVWRIHRHIGMGGDQVIAALTDDATEEEKGDGIRAAEKALYMAMIEEVEPIEGARELIGRLKDAGRTVVMASSAKANEVDHYLDLLEVRDVVDDWTTSADVENTKPSPDLVKAALEKVGAEPGDAAMLGDTPWDCKAADAAGVPTVALVTGGFSTTELTDAGAVAVYQSIPELVEHIDETPLA
jgi:HAD superfamily hydrolase (TIGR01509 family)